MESFGKTLQYYRKKRNLTQAQLATLLSDHGYPIKNGAISTWEKEMAIPNALQFLALCEILDIRHIWNAFIEGSDNPTKFIPLRLIGVSAGTGEYVEDDSIDRYVETDNILANYALRIAGDSMQPLYEDGDIVAVQNTSLLHNGDIGIFYLNGEQYCKRLEGNHLISVNPNYSPIDITELDCFRILGKVLNKIGERKE